MLLARTNRPLWKQLRATGRIHPDDLLQEMEVHLPPVDVGYIARQLGVQVVRQNNLDYAGAVEVNRDQAIIRINRDDHPVRQRFTLAHEIGHLMLHTGTADGMYFRDTNFHGGRQEVQANRYAADLLMPEWMLDMAMSSTGGQVSRLARLFDVSEQSMQYRLENTGRW